MITASPLTRQRSRWQHELACAITDPLELCRRLGLDPSVAPAAAHGSGFGLRVPRGFVDRMRRGDPADPLLRQVWPDAAELLRPSGFVADPLDERSSVSAPGLLHKYAGRALLIATGACAVHCRYCFRREFPYADMQDAGHRWEAAVAAIAADPSIEEVILSGGDPLSLSDGRLAQLSGALAAIGHIRRLRLHTRQPIVLPERVDEGLTDWLATLPWPVVVVVHCNHANEIDAEVRDALARLAAAGAVLLNQSVLLAGVNDSLPALRSLSEALFAAGVLPYYLHLLDRVRGAAHFEVDEPRARRLVGELAAALPGYLVPRLVREAPGAAAKLPVAPSLPDAVTTATAQTRKL